METGWTNSEASVEGNFALPSVCNEQPTQESRPARTILLVEDEALVREVMYEVLQAAGYLVLKSRNAEEALDLQKRWVGTVHVLLTDVVLPGRNGRDLARELRTRHPAMRTIFMSGYGKGVALLGADRDANASFLSKPFSVSALMQKVKESLDVEVESRVPVGAMAAGGSR